MTTIARYAAVFAAVGAVDLATKQLLVTPDGLEHQVGRSYLAIILCVALVNIVAGIRCRVIVPTALVAAGALCNAIDALDGAAQNPIVLVRAINELGTNAVALNVADLAIALGLATVLWQAARAAITHLNTPEAPQP